MYHFIGIGGIGMSALARILLDQRIQVSGSDLRESALTAHLIAQGAQVQIGHSHTLPQATIVYSSAVKTDNPEYQAALAAGLPLMHRSELLALLMQGQKTLAVTGTHGKTSTTALLAHCLETLDVSYAIGGSLCGINGRAGQGPYFVAEADESDGSFLRYHPFGAIVTNLEAEHLDHYGTFDALKSAFQTFFSQVEGPMLYCGDDPHLRALAPSGIAYGFDPCPLQIENFVQREWKIIFDLRFEGVLYPEVEVPLIGRFSALNCAAVFGMGLTLGLSEETLRTSLATFPGVDRRCQHKGEKRGVLFLDDYGHHPTEIRCTLAGIRQAIGERRLVALFQPHRYSRTKDHLDAFVHAFDLADQLYVTAIYPAGESPNGVTAQMLVEKATVPASFLSADVQPQLLPHDVLVTFGAGDITTFHQRQPEPPRLRIGLIFGGTSSEHDISLKSAKFVASALDPALYDVHYFGIDRDGMWAEYSCIPDKCNGGTDLLSLSSLRPCDLYFPVLHGPGGEDGTLQGLFEILGKPYAGPDYRSAAICMDKALTKTLATAAGIRTTPFVVVTHHHRPQIQLRYPVFVKPAHGGSSIGISKVDTPDALEEAIALALSLDTKVIVEEAIISPREFEFALLGGVAPIPGEKLSGGAFVDYALKYGSNAVKTTVTPDLPAALLAQGQELAQRAFAALGCSGMTRVDFLLDRDNRWWLNEMNPIPGLQPLSLFPKIWQREGLSPQALISRLIILGLARHRHAKRYAHI